MPGLDFRRGAEMFISSEGELAAALRIAPADVARYRSAPDAAPDELIERLGMLLVERGRAMQRVGELLQES